MSFSPADQQPANSRQAALTLKQGLDHLYVVQTVPNFDEVLIPLRRTQDIERQRIEAEALEQARVAAQKAAEQAEAQRQAVLAQQVQAAAQAAQNASYGLPANEAKSFIYMHESGNDPTRWNTSGCLGLGQKCPGSALLAVCPNMDYACEDSYFTSYMLGRYGSWKAAYAFWIRTDCRPYCGTWW